jgi:hypothetical protein
LVVHVNAEELTNCKADEADVKTMISDSKNLGDARFELLIKKMSYERGIPLIENPECKEVMKKYFKDLPRFKKEKAKLDKILK